jgi:Fe-S-cluster-containing dehydrogenase component
MKLSKCKYCEKEFKKVDKLNPYCRPMCEIQAKALKKKKHKAKEVQKNKNQRETVSMLKNKLD